MSSLVPIPWQPGYKLTPHTLGYLVAASARIGENLEVTDAWRSYAEQAYYYDLYKNHGGNPASSPDTGLRQHMRGAAFDLRRTDAAVQAVCRSVGLIRDADESWHWNDPNWASMPIIPTDTSTAGGDATPLEEDMAGGMVGLDSGGTLWHLPDDGSKTSLLTMSQLDSLIMTGAIRKVRPEQGTIREQYYVKLSQDVIDRRTEIAARRKAQNR